MEITQEGEGGQVQGLTETAILTATTDTSHNEKGRIKLLRLSSVRIINRILYINNDPGMNYLLPLDNGWRVNDLADEIMRACVEYDVIASYESARYLALRLVKEILKDKRQFDGGFELGWD